MRWNDRYTESKAVEKYMRDDIKSVKIELKIMERRLELQKEIRRMWKERRDLKV